MKDLPVEDRQILHRTPIVSDAGLVRRPAGSARLRTGRHADVVPVGVRFAVNIPPFADPRAVVDLAIEAEASGWDGVFVWDHLQWETHRRLDVHDPWALLSAMAARTERVMLGTAVTPVARRRPWVLAKQVVTLDHLSGGRAVLGVGLGEPAHADFGAFGDEPDPTARSGIVDEALALLDGLMRGDAVEHHGVHFHVDAQLRPRPIQTPRPRIFIAGTHPFRKPLRRALRWDGFFPISYAALLSPQEISDYLGGIDRPADWDIYAALPPGHDVAAFEAAGVTWLVEGAWPDGDWVNELRGRVKARPPV